MEVFGIGEEMEDIVQREFLVSISSKGQRPEPDGLDAIQLHAGRSRGRDGNTVHVKFPQTWSECRDDLGRDRSVRGVWYVFHRQVGLVQMQPELL